jgi:hypothetical protein
VDVDPVVVAGVPLPDAHAVVRAKATTRPAYSWLLFEGIMRMGGSGNPC